MGITPQQTWSGFSPTTVPDNNRQSGFSPTTVPKLSTGSINMASEQIYPRVVSNRYSYSNSDYLLATLGYRFRFDN